MLRKTGVPRVEHMMKEYPFQHREKGYLMDTCLTAQDRYKAYLDYFRIPY